MSTITSYVKEGLTRDERRTLTDHFMGFTKLSDDCDLKTFLDDLNSDEKDAVETIVMKEGRVIQRYTVLHEVAHDDESCPQCGGEDVVRHGTSRGRQRFKCRDCDQFFTELTDTPLEGCRKLEKFAKFVDRNKNKTVRELASTYDISTHTVIRWERLEDQLGW